MDVFVGPASDWHSVSVPVIIYVISYNIGLRYNGTRLYKEVQFYPPLKGQLKLSACIAAFMSFLNEKGWESQIHKSTSQAEKFICKKFWIKSIIQSQQIYVICLIYTFKYQHVWSWSSAGDIHHEHYQTSNIRTTKSQNLNVSHVRLQLSLPNPLKPC